MILGTKKMKTLSSDFFQRDVLSVAPELLGKYIVRNYGNGITESFMVTEVEAYRGEEDKACHASKGRTGRTDVMYLSGGRLYVYLIYGMYWMLNIVTGNENDPQAILIRGVENVSGPGRVTRRLQIDKSFDGEIIPSERIWLASDDAPLPLYTTTPRIGIGYAEEWKDVLWRFVVNS